MHILRKLRTLGRVLKEGRHRVREGLDTRYEMLLSVADLLAIKLTGKDPLWAFKARAKRRRSEFTRPDCFQIGEIRLPRLHDLFEAEDLMLFNHIFEDTFYCYIYYGDCYDEQIVDKFQLATNEGSYGLKNDQVDVRVCEGDIVIDAGSWIGDFAAYASVKGATTYAFEPTKSTFEYLCKTAELNKNIIPINKGLGDTETHAVMSYNVNHTGSNQVLSVGDETRINTYLGGGYSSRACHSNDYYRCLCA